MRFLQMGLEEKLEGNLEPWLCYYCGECSEQCPRDAEPGETMMSLRRWLTVALRLHRHLAALLPVVAGSSSARSSWWRSLTGARASSLYGISHGQHPRLRRRRTRSCPAPAIHIFDWVLAGVLLALLLDATAPACGGSPWAATGRCTCRSRRYVKKALPAARCTSSRRSATRKCERKRPWVIHLVLMLSYVTMLVLIMFFLRDMAGGAGDRLAGARLRLPGHRRAARHHDRLACAGRVKKSRPQYKHSHETDWIFLVLLARRGRSPGILQHVLHRSGLDAAANITYVVHLMGVVPDARRSRCPSASGRTWPTARWPCTSPRCRREALARAQREAAAPPASRLQAA